MTGPPCLPCHLKGKTYVIGLSDDLRGHDAKVQLSPDSLHTEGASWKAVPGPNLPLLLLAQSHKYQGSVLRFTPRCSDRGAGSFPDAC